MLNLLGTWVVLFLILLGWGSLVVWLLRRCGGSVFDGPLSTFQVVWLGYAGLLAGLLLASLVLPIAMLVLVLSIVPAIAGYALRRDAIARATRALWRRPRPHAVLACLIAVTAVAVAYSACDAVQLYDTGLYHLQVVKWSARFPAVLGLANLHQRFGYNNSVHLFGAYTDALWQGVAAHIANGFLLLVVLAQWLSEILTARTPRGRLRQAFCLVTLPFLLAKLWSMDVASLSTDLPLAVFGFVLLLELVSLPPARRALPLTLVLALGAIAVSTKLGGLTLFGVTAIFAVAVVRHGFARREQLALAALPVAIVVGWLVRGVIASGWLLYPVFGRLPVSWSVPSAVAHDDLANIESWARAFGKGPTEVFGHGFWYWFAPWLDKFRTTHEIVLLAVACALLAWRLARGRLTPASRVAVIACALGILQWFVGAPDLRYGAFLFWLFAAAVFAPMIAPALREAVLGPLVVALALALVVWAGGFTVRVDAHVPKWWGRPPAPPRVDTSWISTGSGTEVLHPTSGDQCFDAPLPCTPYLTGTQRDPDSIGAGYTP